MKREHDRNRLHRWIKRSFLVMCVILFDVCMISELKDNAKLRPGQTPDSKKVQESGRAQLELICQDAILFPIPLSKSHPDATVSYEDSWMQSRSFGGARGHEGCDMMANINQRGYYPVLSVSDGVIEKIGWLPQGGWRIGVRSPNGIYFYYAHLSDYAAEFPIGTKIHAGELLGFMGDSGYSEVEGTVGNFAVHLHFGIYLNDEEGNEYAVNSYPVLQQLEDKKLTYIY